MIGRAVHRILTADEAVSAIIGKRCYPNRGQQGITEAFVTYNQVSRPVEYLSDGGQTNLRARVDIKCWGPQGFESPNYVLARELAAACTRAVNAARYSDFGNVHVFSAEIENDFDTYDDQVNNHGVVLDALFHYCQH